MASDFDDFEAELELLLSSEELATLNGLPEDERVQTVQLIRSVLSNERNGMNGLFESMTHTMKYIPSFLLQKLTKKFIEPPIAARITEKLELKHSVSVAKGLAPEYIADTAVHISSEFAVALLDALPDKQVSQIVDLMIEQSPIKLLDICARYVVSFVSDAQLQSLIDELETHVLSAHRMEQLEGIRSI